MKIFEYIKKLIQTNTEVEKIELKKITFGQISDYIEEERKKTSVKEQEVLSAIQEKILIFLDELQNKVKAIENFDVNSKKVEDRIKSVVEEGRKKYLESLEGFVDNLENLQKENLETFIKDIDKIFLDFNKTSKMSYERTTILIGKEMANIKERLKLFSKVLISIFDENKKIVNFFNTFSLIELKLKQIEHAQKDIEQTNEDLINSNKKITQQEKENKKIIEKIEEIKNGNEYLENLEKQKKLWALKKELEDDIIGVKPSINFKSLANFFHIFHHQMKLVKDYRENFSTEFKKDNGKTILNLLDESKLNKQQIIDKIEQINNKRQEIINLETEIKIDETEKLYSQTTKIIFEISNLKNEKAREERKLEKFNGDKKEIIEKIKQEFEKINVELII